MTDLKMKTNISGTPKTSVSTKLLKDAHFEKQIINSFIVEGLHMAEISAVPCCIYLAKNLLPTIADSANVGEDAASIYPTHPK